MNIILQQNTYPVLNIVVVDNVDYYAQEIKTTGGVTLALNRVS